MEIPPTVSPEHIGPGSFPGAFPPGIVIHEPHKPSYTFQRERKFYVPPAHGDSVVAIKPFSEANPAGPIFTKQGASFDKNAQLAKIVKEKMQQIYPRLARKKFGISLSATTSFSRSDEGTHHSVDDEVDSIQRKFDLIPYR